MGRRLWVGVLGCASLIVTAAGDGLAQTGMTINVVVTLTTNSSGAVTMTTGTTPASGATTSSENQPSAPATTSAGSVASPTTGSPGNSGESGASTASLNLSSSNTPGCVSTYPQALAALTAFATTFGQVKTIYAADHGAGVISDSTYKAGLANLLGIGLDAGAAHEMVQIGGDAADITTQIAAVKTELSAVTSVDLLALVASLQAQLVTASLAVSASSGCAVPVAP